MSKDNTWLWIIAALVGGYLLMPEKIKEVTGGLGGGVTVAMPELNMPEMTTIMPEINFPESSLNIPEGWVPNIPEKIIWPDRATIPTPIIKINIPPVPDTPLSIPGIPDIPVPVMPTLPDFLTTPTIPLGAPPGIIDRFREKVAPPAAIAGGGIAAWLTRNLPRAASKWLPRVAPRVAIKGGTTALKFIPYAGWAYAVADLGTTIYELVSGKNVLGDWLGWGEVINPETSETQEPTLKEIPEALAEEEALVGVPEAPRTPEEAREEYLRQRGII